VKKNRIKKNDEVMVIAGNERGKTGKALKVFPEKDRVIVEGVNIRKRHTKPTQQNPQGGIVEKEAPIHVSNVMPLDPKTGEPTRVNAQIVIDEKTGKKKIARIANRSGEMFT
jgi:large subunit ribosomal protein L24